MGVFENTILKLGKKLISFLIISLLLFTGVSGKFGKYNYTNYKKLKRPDNKIKLRSTPVKINAYFVDDLKIISNYFVLIDSKDEKMIKIFDSKSYKLLKSFGPRGQGPEEFIGPTRIIPDQKDKNSFWIFDVSTRYLKKFNINSIFKENFYPEKIIRISSEKCGLPFRLIFTPDEKILGVGAFFKGRISIYDMNGNYIRSIGKIPVILKDDRFAPQHSHGFIGNLAFKDKSKEIYLATRHGSIVEKYSINGNLISTLYGPDTFFPEYDIVPAGEFYTMTYNKKTRFGYVDICYSKKLDRLFLLYSGRYQYNKENKNPVSSNTIYVLDSNDEIAEEIELDKEIYRILLFENGTFFGVSETDGILKFEYNRDKSQGGKN